MTRKTANRKHLRKIQQLRRQQYHPLLHKIHHKHRISRKTIFYMKEYGPHTNVPRKIIRESLRMLLLAAVVSSLGGLALEQSRTAFVAIIPLIILLPALNEIIGAYGTIIASRFSAMLYEGRIRGHWSESRDLRKLFVQISIIGLLTAAASSLLALMLAHVSQGRVSATIWAKVFGLAILDVALLLGIISVAAVLAGLHYYKKGEDPNNFLIPLTTSVADFGNMLLLAVLLRVLF